MKIVRFFHLNWEDSKQSGLNPRELGGSQEGVQEETEDVVAYGEYTYISASAVTLSDPL